MRGSGQGKRDRAREAERKGGQGEGRKERRRRRRRRRRREHLGREHRWIGAIRSRSEGTGRKDCARPSGQNDDDAGRCEREREREREREGGSGKGEGDEGLGVSAMRMPLDRGDTAQTLRETVPGPHRHVPAALCWSPLLPFSTLALPPSLTNPNPRLARILPHSCSTRSSRRWSGKRSLSSSRMSSAFGASSTRWTST